MEEQQQKPENTGKIQEIKRDDKGRFKEGQSGNPAGKPKGSLSLTAMIKKKLESMSPDEKRTALEMLAENIIQDALESNNKMRQLIWNYLDGMPKQTISHGLEEELEGIEVKIIRKKDEVKH